MRVDRAWVPFALAWATVVALPVVLAPVVARLLDRPGAVGFVTDPDPLLAWRLPLALAAGLFAIAPLALAVRQGPARIALVRAGWVALAWLVAAGWAAGWPRTRVLEGAPPCAALLGAPIAGYEAATAWCAQLRAEEQRQAVGVAVAALATVTLAAGSLRVPGLGPAGEGPRYGQEARQSGLVLVALAAGTAAVLACPGTALAVLGAGRLGRLVALASLIGAFLGSLGAIGLASGLRAEHRGREPARSAALAVGWAGHLLALPGAALVVTDFARRWLGGPAWPWLAVGLVAAWVTLVATAARWPSRDLWIGLLVGAAATLGVTSLRLLVPLP